MSQPTVPTVSDTPPAEAATDVDRKVDEAEGAMFNAITEWWNGLSTPARMKAYTRILELDGGDGEASEAADEAEAADGDGKAEAEPEKLKPFDPDDPADFRNRLDWIVGDMGGVATKIAGAVGRLEACKPLLQQVGSNDDTLPGRDAFVLDTLINGAIDQIECECDYLGGLRRRLWQHHMPREKKGGAS